MPATSFSRNELRTISQPICAGIRIYEIGAYEIKHGRQIHLVNFFTGEIGNPQAPEKSGPRNQSRSPAMPATRATVAIAVLPLENLSGEPAEEYFADGMTEALITDLAKIGGLKVISRGSVMGFKGTKQPLAEIGRALGVDSIVEGRSSERATGCAFRRGSLGRRLTNISGRSVMIVNWRTCSPYRTKLRAPSPTRSIRRSTPDCRSAAPSRSGGLPPRPAGKTFLASAHGDRFSFRASVV